MDVHPNDSSNDPTDPVVRAHELAEAALFFHRYPRPGKLEIQATKPLGNQRDLALAYSPGVAAPCLEIASNPETAADYTARANLVGVVSNGTAVLGLGNIGPLASKPVMEGKAVLFKKFAGIDVFDIEVAENRIEQLVDVVAALEPTFGGINLEDIKAPECFEVERLLRERMKIPVFHDDQHGTAIIVSAAVLNAMELSGKKLSEVKIVASGAGAAALACLNLLVSLGAQRKNIWVSDLEGVVYVGREKLMDRWKDPYAQETDKRTLGEIIDGADVFLGLSAAAKELATKSRIIYADGEDERVLRAAQVLIEDGIATPILIGRPSVIDTRLERYGLKIRANQDFEIVDPASDPRFKDYVDLYFAKVGRKGVSPDAAKTIVRTNSTVIAALAVERGDVDALICGLDGRFERHRRTVLDVIGVASSDHDLSAVSMLINSTGTYFLTDTYVTNDPSPVEIANATMLAAGHIRRFGLEPKAALLSASNFGSRDIPSAEKMRKVLEILRERAPDLEVDGEMHGDAALASVFREKSMPNSALKGEANLLVFPTLDSAHITMSIIRAMTDALHVGPILLGAAKPAHILTPAVTSRGVVNMSTLAAVEAASRKG